MISSLCCIIYREFAGATRNYAKRQMMWYRRDKSFLFVRISRDLRHMQSFASSYRNVTEEVLRHLQLSRVEYDHLLETQLRQSHLYNHYLSQKKVALPHRCDDAVEHRLLLHLLQHQRIKAVLSKDSTSEQSGDLLITASDVSPANATRTSPPSSPSQRKGKKARREEVQRDSDRGIADFTAMEFDVRQSEASTKHMKFYVSKFQAMTSEQLASHPFYSSFVAQCEAQRAQLWRERAEEMAQFRLRLLGGGSGGERGGSDGEEKS